MRGGGATYVHVVIEGSLQDELDVGVVVDVGATSHHDHLVGHLDVLGTGLHVLRRGHAHKKEGLGVAEGGVGPAADGAHALDRGDPIVSHQDLQEVCKTTQSTARLASSSG